MKKITILCFLGLIQSHYSFGMLAHKNVIHKITTHKKMRTFHTTTPSAHSIGPVAIVAISAFMITISHSYDIYKLQNEICELKKIIKQNEEKNNLILNNSKQNKEHNIKIKTDE